ncbi:MAG: DEAD/DEAH box helicase [Euryarchaeota archaeon]|nr:DEAD/DEAH box helicase [Euryarchaeota archaeon]
MKVADLGVDPRIVEILKEQGIEGLYPPQERAIPIALEGKSLVLAIPTASGKSLVAYLAVLKHVLNGGKAMYIVPLRALAAEKYDDLRAFEKLGIKVGLSVGDYDSPDPTLARYDVLVATSERADSLLRHRADWLTRLTVVVADEIHLINDGDRGPTLEVTLAKMRQVNPKLQIIALSATIRNSAELAAWLKAEHVQSDWRPVPLKRGVMYNGMVTWTDRSVTQIPATEDDLSGLVEDIIDTGGQALIFVNTRRASEALAKALTASVKPRLKEKELAALKKLSEDLVRRQQEPTSMANRLAKCVEGGTAFHNAGLLNEQRRTIEEAFKKGKIEALVATPTLAYGLNLPSRRVIIRDLNRFDVNLGFSPIPILEIQQMCGRAGRPRYDPYGEAILMAKREEDVEYVMEDYLLSPPEAIESKLGTEPALRFHTLAVIATGHCRTEDELYGFLGQTFFAFHRDVYELRRTVERVLEFLAKEKFIERGPQFRPTFFGRRTSDLYIDPLSAVKLRDALLGTHDAPFFWLWAVCSTPDMPNLYLRRGDYAWVEEKIAEEALTFPIEDYDFFLAQVKTACLLADWIEERTEDEVTKRFGIGPGDIRRMVDQAEWLTYATAELAKIFNRDRVKPLAKLLPRLQYGIKEDLLPLVQLRGVGRVRARALVRAGYRTLRELQKASAGDLSRVPTIGNALAISIKEQLGKEVKPQELAGQTALSEWGS